MEAEGMNIHYSDDPAYIPCDAGLVIYTPAIPESNREIEYVREADFNLKKRSAVLGMIAESYDTIAVAGTHGKTTISSMITHIMHSSGHPVTALIGGIMSNYDTNMIHHEDSKYLVAEADEYDRSFLSLHPKIAVVSTLAADHLDIYGSIEKLEDSFSEFVSQLHPEGMLIIHEKVSDRITRPDNSLVYGTGGDADIRISNIRIEDHQYHFELHVAGESADISLMTPGMHNIENATAAAAACLQSGMSLKEISLALGSYTGVKRRFEYLLADKGMVFIDDYAHHPEELAACIKTARELYPKEKITGVFQPHLYSRTRDFAEEFAHSLETLDEIILLDIYPAREEPIEGVSAKIILDSISNENKIICPKENLLQLIDDKKPEILLTMGAGDIDQFVKPIKEILQKKA
ncbi:MAG: UDP-N-acetylmuramate--L-alanine ligase, partial [Bacteroidota bacterium]